MPELDNKQLQNFNKFLSVFDPDYMTGKQFLEQFKKVIEFVKKIEAKHTKAISDMEATYKKLADKLDRTNNGNTANFSKLFNKELEDLKKKYTDKVADLELRVAEIRDGQDGKDADDEAIYNRLLAELPKKDEIVNSIPMIGERVRDSLEMLNGDDRLMISAIKGLEERLKELDDRPLGGGGGGFSKIHMDMHFHDDETPSGTVNGTNKAFTTAKAPNPTASLQVFVNGQKMTVTEDYTLSGKTITFTTAPPTGSVLRVYYRS